jgi:hypothetical protein
MGSHLFSLGRRRIDRRTLDHFEGTLRYHGALGYRDVAANGPASEDERLKIVPLVFGLLPTIAVRRRGPDQRVKPTIREHLAVLGAPETESLVEVLKAVADQLWATWPLTIGYGNARCKRKGSMADLRANPVLYRRIRTGQGARCAVCGKKFDAAGEETLDHTVPFRIIGDAPDGANWQILCPPCNSGKSERLSALQSPEAMNWIYSDASGGYASGPSIRTRYVVLAQAGHCEEDGCAVGATTSLLTVQKIAPGGLWVADNLEVRCAGHAAPDAQDAPRVGELED